MFPAIDKKMSTLMAAAAPLDGKVSITEAVGTSGVLTLDGGTIAGLTPVSSADVGTFIGGGTPVLDGKTDISAAPMPAPPLDGTKTVTGVADAPILDGKSDVSSTGMPSKESAMIAAEEAAKKTAKNQKTIWVVIGLLLASIAAFFAYKHFFGNKKGA